MSTLQNTNWGNFPYGVAYYRPPTPIALHWEKDLAQIKAAGLNIIRINAFWSLIETTEENYDFSDCDAICAAAKKAGLKVLITLYIVNMPEWMFSKYPDSRMVSAGGRIHFSEHRPDAVAGGWPGLCMDDDRVMKKMKAFVRKITLHYKGSDTVMAFDVIHEPFEEAAQEYYIDSWKNAIYCYCPHTIKKFKDWLLQKYKSLESLNEAWARRYSDWEQVEPPRSFGAYADWMDWRNFSIDAITAESMAAGLEVKKADPGRMIVNHTVEGVANVFAISADMFDLSQTVDIPGISNYGVRFPQNTGLSCDIMRSANRKRGGEFWVGELSGGSGPMFVFIGEDIEHFKPFGFPWKTQDHKKHVWKTLAHGAKGIIYWMWRPEIYGCEIAGMGLTDREGNPTDRVDTVREIADVVFQNEQFFQNARTEQAQVAALYNRNSAIIEGYGAIAKSLPGNSGLSANYKDFKSLSGLAKTCMESNLPIDYLNDKLLKEYLSDYKALILPYAICFNEAEAEKIRRFVSEGGIVLADALCGYFKGNGWGGERVPVYGLDEVFGCKVIEYDYDSEHTVTLDETFGNRIIKSAYIKEKLSVSSGRVAGTFENGAPAVVINEYGKGKAIYFATSIFMNAEQSSVESRNAILSYLLNEAAIRQLISVSKNGSGIEARLLIHDNRMLLIAMNHSDHEAETIVKVKTGWEPREVTDAITRQKAVCNLCRDNVELTVSLPESGVAVYWLAR